MTDVWEKWLVNQRHTRGLPPEGSMVEYTWRCRVRNAAGAELAWDPFSFADNVIEDLELPRPGDTVDDVFPSIGGWAVSFRFRSLQWSLVPESVSTWEVTAVATTKDVWCPDPNVLRTDSVTSREVDVYRAIDPTSADKDGGTQLAASDYVDRAGKPIKKQLGQIQLTVTFLWNTGDPRPEVGGYPNSAAAAPYINTRNDAEFLGFEAGTLRLTGINIDPEEHEYVRVTYQFLWDQWYHMTQQPRVSSQGQPLTTEVDGERHAVEVSWEQLYEEEDWSDFFTTYEFTWLTEGWSARPTIDCGETFALTGEEATEPIGAQIGTELRPEPEVDEEEEGGGEEPGEGGGEGGEEE